MSRAPQGGEPGIGEAAYRDLRAGVLLRQEIPTWEWPDWAELPPAIRARIESVVRSVEAIRRRGKGAPAAAQEGRRMVEP